MSPWPPFPRHCANTSPVFFYVTTDGETKQDNPVGYFSKEKVSYDDYNLACITVFPPYQRKAFGILMIEFSAYGSGVDIAK